MTEMRSESREVFKEYLLLHYLHARSNCLHICLKLLPRDRGACPSDAVLSIASIVAHLLSKQSLRLQQYLRAELEIPPSVFTVALLLEAKDAQVPGEGDQPLKEVQIHGLTALLLLTKLAKSTLRSMLVCLRCKSKSLVHKA